MTRWTKPLKIRLQGDEEAASQYVGRARKELAILETEMEKRGWKSSQRQVNLPDNTSLRIGIIYGQAFADIVSGPVRVPEKEEEGQEVSDVVEQLKEDAEFERRTLIIIGTYPAGYTFQNWENTPRPNSMAVWHIEAGDLYPLLDELDEPVDYPLARTRLLELMAMRKNGSINLDDPNQCKIYDVKPTVKTEGNSTDGVSYLHEQMRRTGDWHEDMEWPFGATFNSCCDKEDEEYAEDVADDDWFFKLDARSNWGSRQAYCKWISTGQYTGYYQYYPMPEYHYEVWCSGDENPLGCYFSIETSYHDNHTPHPAKICADNAWIATAGNHPVQPKILRWHSIFPDQANNGTIYHANSARTYRFNPYSFKVNCNYKGYIKVRVRKTYNPSTYTDRVEIKLEDLEHPINMVDLAKKIKDAANSCYHQVPGNDDDQDGIESFYASADGFFFSRVDPFYAPWNTQGLPQFDVVIYEQDPEEHESWEWEFIDWAIDFDCPITPMIDLSFGHSTYSQRWTTHGADYESTGGDYTLHWWYEGNPPPNMASRWKHAVMCGIAQGERMAYAFEYGLWQKQLGFQFPSALQTFRCDFRWQYKKDSLKESEHGITNPLADDDYHLNCFAPIPGMHRLAGFLYRVSSMNEYAWWNFHMFNDACINYSQAEAPGSFPSSTNPDSDDFNKNLARSEPVPCLSVCEVKPRVVSFKQSREERGITHVNRDTSV